MNSSTPTSNTPTLSNHLKLNRSMKKNSAQNHMETFHFNSPAIKRNSKSDLISSANSISLDSIVIEYLRKQHALCKNPVVTCPPFDLSQPHRCPEPLNRNLAPLNIASRIQRRQFIPPFGGLYGSKMDRKFIYSRFRPVKFFRAFTPTTSWCCTFAVSSKLLELNTTDLYSI